MYAGIEGGRRGEPGLEKRRGALMGPLSVHVGGRYRSRNGVCWGFCGVVDCELAQARRSVEED
jgi:hypothetical protein